MSDHAHHPLDRYTCEEVLRRLEEFIDRELSARETALVAEHLAVCAACTSELAFETAYLDDVRAKLHRIKAPPELLRAVTGLLAASRPAAAPD